jgi:hypothetical protein
MAGNAAGTVLAENPGMDRITYRSFLVRSWELDGSAVRASIEEVQSGSRVELRGSEAARVVAAFERALPEPEAAGYAALPAAGQPGGADAGQPSDPDPAPVGTDATEREAYEVTAGVGGAGPRAAPRA